MNHKHVDSGQKHSACINLPGQFQKSFLLWAVKHNMRERVQNPSLQKRQTLWFAQTACVLGCDRAACWRIQSHGCWVLGKRGPWRAARRPCECQWKLRESVFCLQGEVGEQGLAGRPGEKVCLFIPLSLSANTHYTPGLVATPIVVLGTGVTTTNQEHLNRCSEVTCGVGGRAQERAPHSDAGAAGGDGEEVPWQNPKE